MLAPEQIVRLEDDAVVLLDQRRLPDEDVELRCGTAAEVADAIRTLVVRGAPAIGVAAAYGLALAAERGEDLDEADAVLRASRPTAVNLAWALDEMRGRSVARARARDPHATRSSAAGGWPRTRPTCFAPGTRALTHCNAGGLATGGYGSAVGALRRRVGARSARARLGRRDATAAPGRAPDGLGARDARRSRTP